MDSLLQSSNSQTQDLNNSSGSTEQNSVGINGHGAAEASSSMSPSGSSAESGDGRKLLNEEKAVFELPVPLPMPPVLNMQYICETASRLLFLSVHWLKSISVLNVRSDTLQESILKGRWCELFVLGLFQCSSQFCLGSMLAAMNSHLQTCAVLGQLKMDKYEEVHEQISSLQVILKTVEKLKLSNLEFGYLKLISFTSTDTPATADSYQMRSIQSQAYQELYDHIQDTAASSLSGARPGPDSGDQRTPLERYSDLLLLLPSLRSFNRQVLVELFFSGLIGNVQIENVIPFILKMDVLQIFGQTDGTGTGGTQENSFSLASVVSNHVASSGNKRNSLFTVKSGI